MAKYQTDNWRYNIRKSKLISDNRLGIFLDQIAQHGRVGQALRAAGICDMVVLDRKKVDDEFAAAYRLAKLAYASKVEAEAYKQILGIDENGRKIFSTNTLLQMELKRTNPEYRDTGGVESHPNLCSVRIIPREK